MKLARSDERAHPSRDELEAAPGAVLARRWVRAAPRQLFLPVRDN